MNNNLNLSIIIPAYNCENTIARCLESILSCPYPGYEIIVIDDGSVDDTKQVLQKYIEKIILFTQNNSGVSIARNKGINIARKEYLVFLDGDDIFVENWWDKMDNYYENDITIYNYTRAYNDLTVEVKTLIKEDISKNDILETYIITDKLNGVCGKVYKRNFLVDNNLMFPQDMKIGEDAFFFGNALKVARKVQYYPKSFYLYIDNINSASYNKRDDFVDQNKLYQLKKSFLLDQDFMFLENELNKKYLGDILSRFRDRIDKYENFYNISQIALRFESIQQLMLYNFKNLSIRRKYQMYLLKKGYINSLYFELVMENLLNKIKSIMNYK